MTLEFLTSAPIALLPVLCFLGALIYFDSFKLVSRRSVLLAMVVGAAAAAASYFANAALLGALDVDFLAYSRYLSPWVEECLKALVLVPLIRRGRIALLVDASIAGFAVGTGFALVENLYYLAVRPDSALAVQVIRGFGTAIMHGGATALFAIISVSIFERRPGSGYASFLPGLIAASLIHSAYNHLLTRPMVATLAILLVLPPLMYLVFRRSEQSLRDWLDTDMDSDMELLQLINSHGFSETHVGRYLHSLSGRFRGEVVADMLCYLRLHVELALRAKGVLLMRENGFDPEIDENVRDSLAELRYLERSIGRTGLLAIRPVLRMTSKDLWQIYQLQR